MKDSWMLTMRAAKIVDALFSSPILCSMSYSPCCCYVFAIGLNRLDPLHCEVEMGKRKCRIIIIMLLLLVYIANISSNYQHGVENESTRLRQQWLKLKLNCSSTKLDTCCSLRKLVGSIHNQVINHYKWTSFYPAYTCFHFLSLCYDLPSFSTNDLIAARQAFSYQIILRHCKTKSAHQNNLQHNKKIQKHTEKHISNPRGSKRSLRYLKKIELRNPLKRRKITC